jgi:hypothetical protein
MKSKFSKKAKKKPKRPKFSKKSQKAKFAKKTKLAKIAFCQIWLFVKFCFLGNFWILDFLEQVAVCHFGGYIRTT